MRKHFQRRGKSDHISGICRFIADAADKTLQIINRLEIFPDFIPKHGVFIQLLNSGKSVLNFLLIN